MKDKLFSFLRNASLTLAICVAIGIAALAPIISAFADPVAAAQAIAPAADAAFTIDKTAAVDPAVNGIFGVIGAIVGFGIRMIFGPKGKFPLSEEMQKYLEMASHYALTQLQAKVRQQALDMRNPTVKNQAIAEAANMALSFTPALVSQLGLTQASAQNYVAGQLTKLFDKQQGA